MREAPPLRLLIGAAAVLFAATWTAIYVADSLTTPSLHRIDVRPTILCVSLVGLNAVSYLAWPSRWNVVAHTQLVFSVVAYVIPIYSLGVLNAMPTEALDLYYRVTALGFFAMTVGVAIGAGMASPLRAEALRVKFQVGTDESDERIRRRVKMLIWLSIGGIVTSFAVMGFVPALTPDPLTAKFFRGAYAAPYAPVAPLYRASTSIIAVLLPLVAMYAYTRRERAWYGALVCSIGVMLLGLQREPAVTGFLILIGVALAVRKRGLPRYFALLIGTYFIGGALYSVLGALGLGGFATNSPTAPTSFLAQVAGGAPDIKDHVTFMQAWLTGSPPLTHGKTFFGGLIPGNFEWNTSVWSLQVVNPGVPIERIASGGLRLPGPIWGLVSFGWVGVVAVSFFSGVLTGYLSRLASRLVPSANLATAVTWMVLYIAAMEVIPNFYRLSYLSVGQLVVVLVMIRYVSTRTPSSADIRV